jgi:RHS repeat-associated protein
MLKVNAGDIVTAGAFGKYIDKTGSNTFSVDDLVGLLASAFGYSAGSVETGIQYSGMDNGMGLLGLLKPQQDGVRAYLNYILFDNNFLDPEVGYEPLPDGATTYQKLSKIINIGKNGYLYLYVSCESLYDYKVYFDDIAVSVEKSNITASTDYYPFGMAIAENSTGLDDPVTNKYLYNGKELQNELGLDTYLADFRMYDPSLGRWWQVDPIDKEDLSPYSWVTNNPIGYSDPLGLDSIPVNEMDWPNVNPDQDVIILDEVVVESTYTGSTADDSPNIKYAGMIEYNTEMGNDPNLPRASGAVEPVYPEAYLIPLPKGLGALGGGLKASRTLSLAGSKIIQRGGNTISNATLKAWKLTQEQAYKAIHAFKREKGLGNKDHKNFHQNGDISDSRGNILGNIHRYVD